MKNDETLKKKIGELEQTIKEWTNEVNMLGNQCAFTDRMLEMIIVKSLEIKHLYDDNNLDHDKKVFYVLFEQQGYEQLIVKVKAEDEDIAYAVAAEAYLGDQIDRYIVEPKNLGRYDCPIIDECGYQLDYSECMEEDEIPEDEE